ncbi:tetratricopeptide repeat protein [Micromonospora ureilytica]|uniref:tetratricopeptide repeat protein n=1 Tax=Micromonospora ureilytica TaxID=709868 RepID=UPI0033D9E7F4
MRYRYEDLGDEEFQRLIQALLTHAFGPDVHAMPLGQADGGRDAVHGTLVYQVKFTKNPDRKDPVTWLLRAIDGEASRIQDLVARGVRGYCLVTNVAGTGMLGSGSIDRLDAALVARSEAWGIQITRWWRDEIDTQMRCAPDSIIRSFLNVLPPSQVLAREAQLSGALPGWDAHLVADAAVAGHGGPSSGSGRFRHSVTTPLSALTSLNPPFGRLPSTVHGRSVEVDRLLDAADRRVRVLTGMGGVGKTTVALRAGAIARESGDQVFWINATSAATVTEALQAVAVLVGAPESAVAEAWSRGGRAAADLLWRYLAAWERRWLLVFDNADDLDVLGCPGAALSDGTGWVRQSAGNGVAVVVTTRDQSRKPWGTTADVTPVAILDDSAAASVLLGLAPGAGVREEARPLAVRLGNLPLALQLAGAYLAAAAEDPLAATRTFGEYDSLLAETPLRIDSMMADLTGDLRDDDDRARDSVARTWELSIRLLEARRSGPVREALRLLAWFAPNVPLPKEFVDPERLAGTPAWPARTKPADIRRAFAALSRFGLLDVVQNDGGPAYQMHPLVAEVTIAAVQDPDVHRGAAGTAYAVLVTETPAAGRDPKHWPAFAPIAEHWPVMLRRLPPVLPAEKVDLVLTFACTAINYLRATARFSSAVELSAEALRRCDATTVPVLLRLGIRYQGALVFRDLGDLARAETEFRDITRIADLSAEEDSDALKVSAQYELAAVLQRQGRYAEAEQEFNQVLDEEVVRYGETAHTTLLTRHDRAASLRALGRIGEATREITFVTAALGQVLGPDHPDALVARHELAVALRDDNQFTRAEAEFREVLAVERRVLGDLHPSVLQTRGNIALTLMLQSRLDEADGEYQAVLDSLTEILGPTHEISLVTRHNLTVVHMLLGKISNQRAEETFRVIITNLLDQLAPDHNDVLAVRADLARTLQVQGKIVEAVAEFDTVIDHQIRRLGAAHPATLVSRSQRAAATVHLHGGESVVRELSEIIDRQLEIHPDRHDNILLNRKVLADVLLRAGRADEAEIQLRIVERAWMNAPEAKNDLRMPELRRDLAEVLRDQGRPEAAAAHLQEILDSVAGKLDDAHPLVVSVRQHLAVSLKDAGDPGGAVDHYHAVLAVQEERHGRDSHQALIVRHNRAIALRDDGRVEEAEAELRRLIRVQRKALGDEHPTTLISRQSLAKTLAEQGRWPEAERDYRAVLAAQRRLGTLQPATLITWGNLAYGLAAFGDPRATAEYEAAFDAHERVFGSDHPKTLTCRNNLALTLARNGDLIGAAAHLRALHQFNCDRYGPIHSETLLGRCNLLFTLAMQGRSAAARTGLAALLPMVREEYGHGSRAEAYLVRGYNHLLRQLGQATIDEPGGDRLDEALARQHSIEHPWLTIADHQLIELSVLSLAPPQRSSPSSRG